MNIQKKLSQSFQLFQEKKYFKSIEILNTIISKYPNNYDAYSNKAIILLSINKQVEAKDCFEKALAIKFNEAIANNFVKLLLNLGEWHYAEKINNKLIDNFGKKFEFEKNKGLIFKGSKKNNEAIKIYHELISNHPKEIDLYLHLGFVLNLDEQYEESIACYRKGLQLNENFYPLIYNLAVTLNNAQNYEDAIKTFEKSLELNPKNSNAWLTMASAQIKLNKFNDAKQSIQQVLNINPQNKEEQEINANALFQLGVMDITQNKHQETIKNFEDVIKINPYHVEANHHLGLTYLKIKNFQQAAKYYKYRVKKTPKKIGRFDDFNYPNINGNTSLLVAKEQGIGDELILVRLLEILALEVKELVYVSSNKLHRFIENNLKKVKVINEDHYLQNENSIYKNFTKINLHSILNYIHNPLDIIKTVNKFNIDDKLVKKYAAKFKKTKKLIGIAWKSKNGANDIKKSMQLNDLNDILKMHDKYSYVNLQYGNVKDEIRNENEKNDSKIQYDNELDYFDDIYSLAALIKSCDIVVTSSNVTAHIAGILGVKTFILVPKFNGKIWYWHDDDEISSWYPSVKLFTQKYPDDWKEPVLEILNELKYSD